MRKFKIGDNVKICRSNQIHDGKIIDTKYLGIFKQYAVEYSFIEERGGIDTEDIGKTDIDWVSPYDIFRSPNNELNN